MKSTETYMAFAPLFRYPSVDFGRQTATCYEKLSEHYPEAALRFEPFLKYINSCSPDQMEELYSKTFDVQPICYLDLGYVIFGEDYKRGTFLTCMQEEQRKAGIDTTPELPDNLAYVLEMLTKHPDKLFIDELSAKIIVPGLRKMIAEFDSARVDLKLQVIKKLHKAIIQEELNSGNVYRNAFESLLNVFSTDFVPALEAVQSAEEELHQQSFFRKENSVNQLINNYKID